MIKSSQNILILGACGQLGSELTPALRKIYGNSHVFASDLRENDKNVSDVGPYFRLNVMDKASLESAVCKYKITQIYLLAAVLSANGESHVQHAWDLNMTSLINVLEVGRIHKLHRIFWPSSIAVFGPASEKDNCGQYSPQEPQTMYGVSKSSGEYWCSYYYSKYGLNVRSIRFPGLLSVAAMPGGGTTDYSVDMFHHALQGKPYTCYLREDTRLPMMYMPDAVRAVIELMKAPMDRLNIHTSYNLAAMSFTPEELERAIRIYIPGFRVKYRPDFRQGIADSWPTSIDDRYSRVNWGWKYTYTLNAMVAEMVELLSSKYINMGKRVEDIRMTKHSTELY